MPPPGPGTWSRDVSLHLLVRTERNVAGEKATGRGYQGRRNLTFPSLLSAQTTQSYGSVCKRGDGGKFRKCLRTPVLGEPCSGVGGRGLELGVRPAWWSQPAKAQIRGKARLPGLCSGQSAGNTGSSWQTQPAGPDRRMWAPPPGTEAQRGFQFTSQRNPITTDHSPDMERLYRIVEPTVHPVRVPLGAEGTLLRCRELVGLTTDDGSCSCVWLWGDWGGGPQGWGVRPVKEGSIANTPSALDSGCVPRRLLCHWSSSEPRLESLPTGVTPNRDHAVQTGP